MGGDHGVVVVVVVVDFVVVDVDVVLVVSRTLSLASILDMQMRIRAALRSDGRRIRSYASTCER